MKSIKGSKVTFWTNCAFSLTLSFTMLKNGQIYFKNVTVKPPQDFKSIFGHFSTLWMIGLNYNSVKWFLDKLRDRDSSIKDQHLIHPQHFPKNTYYLSLDMNTYGYQSIRNVSFSENVAYVSKVWFLKIETENAFEKGFKKNWNWSCEIKKI